MANARAEVVRVCGICNAAFAEGDVFLVSGLRIGPHQHSKVCNVAFASIVANLGRLRVEGNPLYVSCPDPGTGDGGNVIFRLSWVESHADDQP